MARISIPLDAITSRLNLSDRFSSVRSQSIASRFANIKPISEFLDLKRLSKPNNFGEVQSRVNYNLSHFSSNYAVVFVMLSVYSLLTNLWLLFDIILVVGGMWAIGKLGGNDLEIGTLRVTSSQLYTGLACIAVPVAFISSPITTFLWLIGATGTYRECFFRGGGLGGRPRTPYDLPPWGRPPGGRPGRRNDRQRDLRRSWAYDDRVEELDTDDDISQGVELDQDYGDKRFVSDELRFTGIDLGSGGLRRRRSGDKYNDFTPSEDEDDYNPNSSLVPRQELQMVYKDKEDMLVERALERIARARALGKANVKLSRAEIDALDRSERNQNPPRSSAAPQMVAPKSKKEAPIKRKPVEVRKMTGRNDNKSASNSPRRKPFETRDRGPSIASNTSSRGEREDPVAAYQGYPVDQEYSHVGRRLPYPQGHYFAVPRHAESSRQGHRTNSTQSLRQQQQLQQQIQQAPPYQHPYFATRYASNPDAIYSQRPGSNSSRASRPDPSEPDWEPRARSTSSLVNVPLDQLPYQTSTSRAPRFDPSDPRYASPQRRVASGPPLAHQHSPVTYRRPQDELFLPNDSDDVMRYLAPSGSEQEDDDDDSDYDEGVQVDVSERPGGDYAIQTRSATASNTGNKGKNGTSKKAAGKARRR
ncbi:uncharacterized protein A1O9_01059 [Exophiala aquamarina CBS 119918]|uniref:Prenylated Rab acceptor 1 n=1 Tax=Exophiala aquamarina CBS 119918 TaxID=1182545 RepID=A0A072PUP1_9EURO|nr:uncharacterized protein A1O9_01059 [Exophiala aquamarina CBS 119918]KEF63083.1 hypothetical protein A1O9_01059 [Exophiala aquamarina CBS 119918]